MRNWGRTWSTWFIMEGPGKTLWKIDEHWWTLTEINKFQDLRVPMGTLYWNKATTLAPFLLVPPSSRSSRIKFGDCWACRRSWVHPKGATQRRSWLGWLFPIYGGKKMFQTTNQLFCGYNQAVICPTVARFFGLYHGYILKYAKFGHLWKPLAHHYTMGR